ncbi:MAG: hypothetical protein AAFT19_11045, partial [Pseudomonadota bacterium]
TEIDDRQGWVTDDLTRRGAVARLGWTRGEVTDGEAVDTHVKSDGSDASSVVLRCSGDGNDGRLSPANKAPHFENAGGAGLRLKLSDVPPAMFPEAWARPSRHCAERRLRPGLAEAGV